jgi:beta-lactamase regulating signal transducer with metallopeptidase domain
MAATTNSEPVGAPSEATSSSSASRSEHRAAAAAARVWTAGLLLGAFGLALSIFVVGRLFVTWHVTPHAASHHISLLGQRLGYPAANLDALVVLALAVAGLAVGAMTVLGAVRELRATKSFERRLAAQGPRPLNGAFVIDDERPQAFCAGLLKPRVYVSSGTVALLDGAALNAVLAHEAHHARLRDPLRLAVGRVLARALFFVPGLDEVVRRHQDLAELGADETAMNAGPDNSSALARAMLTFSESSPAVSSAGIDPRRVDHLLGEPPSWRFPTLLCLAAAGAIALVAAIAVLAAQVAAGSATLAPPFLSHQPCVLVLALIPVVVGLGGAGVARALRARPPLAQATPERRCGSGVNS